jgi:hypothetical protein
MPTLPHTLGGWLSLIGLLLGALGLTVVRKLRPPRDRGMVAPAKRALGLGLMHQIFRLFRVPQNVQDRAIDEQFDAPEPPSRDGQPPGAGTPPRQPDA